MKALCRIGGLVAAAALMSGCASQIAKPWQEMELAPIRTAPTTSTAPEEIATDTQEPDDAIMTASLPDRSLKNLYIENTPNRVGDTLSVKITLNDSASFKNSSNKARKSRNNTGTDFKIGLFTLGAEGEADIAAEGDSSSSGQGTIVRSERLQLQLTATIQEVLPNGHLRIEGSQQVLVNQEMRDVLVAGIVNPRDIDENNSVDYSKIAEARARYGGKGFVSNVQKPGWGTQIWDKVSPF
jgi:flagellar L-ring protein FlgH